MKVRRPGVLSLAFVLIVVLLPRRLRAGEGRFYISGLRCEYLENPLAVNSGQPRLSWILSSPVRGWKQQAFRIQVASSRQKLLSGEADLWDSGRVESDETVHVAYAGKPLVSRQQCFWRVAVWPRGNSSPRWSDVASWRMGILEKEGWHALWIGRKDDLPPDRSPPATYLRREFGIKKRVRGAILYATARGIYEARINGLKVGDEILAPGWTDFSKRILYQAYDVTPMVHRGDNCLGAILGDGWYSGFIGYAGKRAYYGSQTSLLAQLHVEYADGSEEWITSDASWQAGDGPIRSSDLQMGEVYDSRRDLGSWDLAGYKSSGWQPADLFAPPLVELNAQPCPGVKIVAHIKAQKISEPQKEIYVFDLGQNIAGFVRLRVKGAAGSEVKLRHAEVLNPDGTIYTANLRKARATDTFILSGKGIEVFQPHFTFHGFRYVEVSGLPTSPTGDTIRGVAISQGLEETGRFTCSNPLVNRLQHNILWSQRANFIAVPTDCPQRDERLGWMGDAQIFAPTAAYNMDVASFLGKWLQDVTDAQSDEGAFRDTAPFMAGWGSDGAPGWGDAGVIVPWIIYQCYADPRLITTHYAAMKRWMEYIAAANPDFLRRNRLNNNYGDWVAAAADTPKELLATAFWAYDALLMAKMAKAIGNSRDAISYGELFEKIRAQFQKTYIDDDGRISGNTQTGYALGLFMGLFPAELRHRAAQYLVADILQRGNHISTGFIGVRHLLPVLCDAGHADVAFRLLANTTYPSWGYMIDRGATSIWERWDGWTAEKGFQDPGMNSFNHYAFGSVGEWLYRYVAGIATSEEHPGYQRVIIRPFIGGGLKWVRAIYRSPRGIVSSGWAWLPDGGLQMRVVIPANCSAEVFLPAISADQIRVPRLRRAQTSVIRCLGRSGDRQIVEIGSGVYTFRIRPQEKK